MRKRRAFNIALLYLFTFLLFYSSFFPLSYVLHIVNFALIVLFFRWLFFFVLGFVPTTLSTIEFKFAPAADKTDQLEKHKKKLGILGMLGPSEERRFFEPTGSQTHSHSSVTQETAPIPRLAAHPTTIFPPLYPPLSNFSHLTALHPTIFGGHSLSAIDFTLNRSNTHSTANIWPGSATLSSTPTGQLSSAAPSNAVSSGRFSAFDLHPSNQGESFGYIFYLFIILSLFYFFHFVFIVSPFG